MDFNPEIGTEFSFYPISSSNTNFLWITVEVAANTDLIYGGYVTINGTTMGTLDDLDFYYSEKNKENGN